MAVPPATRGEETERGGQIPRHPGPDVRTACAARHVHSRKSHRAGPGLGDQALPEQRDAGRPQPRSGAVQAAISAISNGAQIGGAAGCQVEPPD